MPAGVSVDPKFSQSGEGEASEPKKTFVLEDGDIVKLCGFVINMEEINNEGLKRMRKMLPKESYKLMKNRKSSRLCRLRKKEVVKKAFENSGDLARENEELRQKLQEAYAKIQICMLEAQENGLTASEAHDTISESVTSSVHGPGSYDAASMESDSLPQEMSFYS